MAQSTNECAVKWSDFDLDNDLDILVMGPISTILYRNDYGNFIDHQAGFTHLIHGDADWGDYDRDGDEDLIIMGGDGYYYDQTILYNNENGVFTEVETNIIGLSDGGLEWGDFDNDGFPDLAIMGADWYFSNTEFYTIIYKNEGDGQFTDIAAGLVPVFRGCPRWGDYDGDGDLDLLARPLGSPFINYIYRNDSTSFVDIGANLPYINYSDACWGDYDGDGDLDILISKQENYYNIGSQIYLNDEGVFSSIDAELEALGFSNCAWGDIDGDRDLDFVITGTKQNWDYKTVLYKNNARSNAPPLSPDSMISMALGETILLMWSAGWDEETLETGLTYNIGLGNEPGVYNIISPMSDDTAGIQRRIEYGNAGLNKIMKVNGLSQDETYYWKVQTVDNTFNCSMEPEEMSFYFPAGNQPPVAENDYFSMPIDTTIALNILSNDFDPDGDSIVLHSILVCHSMVT